MGDSGEEKGREWVTVEDSGEERERQWRIVGKKGGDSGG